MIIISPLSCKRGNCLRSYHALCGEGEVAAYDGDELFVQIWNLKVTPKISVFLWRVFGNRLPSSDNLLKRNIQVDGQDFNCPFCELAAESLDHMLLWCHKAEEVWKKCYGWMQSITLLPGTMRMHYNQHTLAKKKKLKKKSVQGGRLCSLAFYVFSGKIETA